MKFPFFITRKEHEEVVKELKARLHDLERHFVTKRDPATGQVIETLADRVERRLAGKSGKTWQQTRAWLELTDGGRRPMPGSPNPAGAVKMASKAEEKAANGEQSRT